MMDGLSRVQVTGIARHAMSLLIVIGLVTFLTRLYVSRRRFWRLRARGLCMPPWNPVFGHLLLTSRILRRLPLGAHPHYISIELQKLYPDLGELYYLDLWPFSVPFLVITEPKLADNLMSRVPAKDRDFVSFLRPITGGNDMLTMENEEWKHWRTTFSPGFQPSHILSLVPDIIKTTLRFRDILQDFAEKDKIFLLEEHTMNLTLDIIGKVVLDANLDNLKKPHQLIKALRSQIEWTTYGNNATLKVPNPLRLLVQWRNKSIMDNYLKPVIRQRFVDHCHSAQRSSRSIISLALKSHHKHSTDSSSTGNSTMPADITSFLDVARAQAKLFLFAGHDTTSATICYAYHALSSSPVVLASLRAELDKVLGSDVALAPARLSANPNLLNDLLYLAAVLHEVLRLYPPASIVRAGKQDLVLTSTEGDRYPSEGTNLWAVHLAMHRDPRRWTEPHRFLPERWLSKPGDALHQPERGAWRAFERGPRACLARDLAIVEMKVCLALTVRELDVRSAYVEWDTGKGRKRHQWEIDGELAFQTAVAAAHPRDGMPVRVKIAERALENRGKLD